LRNVLLIDDNPLQLHTREVILKEAGFAVRTADTPSVALETLERETEAMTIGVVVTDHMMPEVSGAEFVRRLRKVNPHVPVIVVSGLVEAEQEYAGLDVVFQTKPCPPLELIELVRRAVEAA
jgi:DNA-binding response OmpR family regulator